MNGKDTRRKLTKIAKQVKLALDTSDIDALETLEFDVAEIRDHADAMAELQDWTTEDGFNECWLFQRASASAHRLLDSVQQFLNDY